MKKPFAKKMIMGAMALTLIGGSGVALISKNAFAAIPNAPVASTAPATSVAPQKDPQDNHSWEGNNVASAQLLTFLKLDKTTFKTKSATETLAQIATDQGISRDALKAELTTEFNAKLDKEKADFATNIDKTVDSIQKGENGRHGGGKKGGDRIDLTSVATALGYATVVELKTALVSGTSIADLATAKGVTVQSVIDLEVVQIVKDLDTKLAAGTITQAEYDKQKAASTAKATSNVNDKNDHKGDFGGYGGGKQGGAKIDLTTVATALGYATVAELKTALVPGTSIADLATAKGVTVQSVIDLQVVQIVKNLDLELANKKITQAQYDTQKANSSKIATKIVYNKQDNKGEKKQEKNQNDKEVNDDATTAPTAAPSTN